MSVNPGGNGQWVRTRTEEGAKSFQQERDADAARQAPGIERSLEMRRRVRGKLRGLLHLR